MSFLRRLFEAPKAPDISQLEADENVKALIRATQYKDELIIKDAILALCRLNDVRAAKPLQRAITSLFRKNRMN